jgi:serine phosphatase RsbU (regulator of sigma subunit)
MFKTYLTSPISAERNALFIRGSLLITAGSSIAILETYAAIYLGLHTVPYKQAIFIALFVCFMNSILISITYFKKSFLVWHEWAIFGTTLIICQIGFSLWVFRLEDLRLLALINALTIITIMLYYTNLIQSVLISAGTLLNYLIMTWYSIKIAGHPGSFAEEAFYSVSIFPSFILVSAAFFINKKRESMQKVGAELEKLNADLFRTNIQLKREQSMSEIEMDIASEIQEVIFPRRVPVVSDWDIAFLTRPYGAVSGDFYDFYTKDDTLQGISLFDVSGHGVAPALITILAKPVIYNNFKNSLTSGLGDVLVLSNDELHKELEAVNLYITGLMLRMEGADVEYVNAGHPDLLYFNSGSKGVSVITDSLSSFKGHPLGITVSEHNYNTLKFKVETGDFLIFYSDGLTESRNSDGRQYGTSRLIKAIENSCSSDAAEMLDYIIDSLNDFSDSIKPGDDITVIVARKK